MNLFLNAVSNQGVIILFDNDRNLVSRKNIEVLGNESSKLIDLFHGFLIENNLQYSDLENIVVINGPGSFTGIRTTSLMINTINFVIGKNITDLSYFDLFDSYPICKPSSKRDTFIKKLKDSEIEVIKNEDLQFYFEKENIREIYGEISKELFVNIKIIDDINYKSIIDKVVFKRQNIIKPLYIKKPSIT